jgi:hypothetical protein
MALASMHTQSPDTDPESERVQIRILRSMHVWQRLAQVEALNAMAESFTMVGLRRRHPMASPERLQQLLRDVRMQMLNASDTPSGRPTSPGSEP